MTTKIDTSKYKNYICPLLNCVFLGFATLEIIFPKLLINLFINFFSSPPGLRGNRETRSMYWPSIMFCLMLWETCIPIMLWTDGTTGGMLASVGTAIVSVVNPDGPSSIDPCASSLSVALVSGLVQVVAPSLCSPTSSCVLAALEAFQPIIAIVNENMQNSNKIMLQINFFCNALNDKRYSN